MSSRYTCAGAEGAPSARAARRVSEFALQGVESSPKAAVVYTLSIGKGDRASDAYSEESQFIADRMAEIESVSARKATLLNPTEDDETVQVLRRRLFDRINDRDAANVIAAYRESWNSNRDSVISEASRPETIDAFRASYPFHPDVLATLTGKTATLVTFQRVRGMLRLLAGTVAYLWNTKPADATAIHLHHVDPGFPPIYEEIATRLGQRAYVPAIRNDIVAAEPGKKALAQDLDDAHYRGMAPYASYVARTIFIHTLAYNDQLKGITPEHLRYSILGPETDISFIDDARKRFFEDSSYLDDRPTAPLRFLVEANLTQIIRRQELHADAGQVRAELNDRIKRIFGGTYFEIVPFWLSCHTMACSATKFSSARFARASSTAFTSIEAARCSMGLAIQTPTFGSMRIPSSSRWTMRVSTTSGRDPKWIQAAARPAAKMRAAELAAAVERARALTRALLAAMARLPSVGPVEIQGHHLKPSRPKQSCARR
jgi:hypothetical protein